MSATISSSLSGSPNSVKLEPIHENEVLNSTVTSTTTTQTAPVVKPNKPKNRKRVNSAEKRSQHNAIERQRRETLNGKFFSLARLLPSLASVRRPSKSAIVNGSIAHLNYQRSQRLAAVKLLRQICAENDQLVEEINHWRSRAGVPSKDSSSAWTSQMDDIANVEKEVFGNFTNEDGDDDNDNDNDDDIANENFLEGGNANSVSSLIDSQPSVDMDMAKNFFTNVQQHQSQCTPSAPINVPANNGGMNWSRDFASAFGSISSSTASSLPFNAFMSDAFDHSASGSPANSIQGNMVLTPPEMGMYTHTPSPRSSLGDEISRNGSNNNGNNNRVGRGGMSVEQMMFLQSMQQHAGGPVRQNSMPSLTPGSMHNNLFSQDGFRNNHNSPMNMFNDLFAQHAQNHVPSAQTLLSAAVANGSDAFTQSLLAQMFPSQGVSDDSVQHWRKLAMSGMNNQMNSNPMTASGRNGRPAVVRSSSMWEQPLEGF